MNEDAQQSVTSITFHHGDNYVTLPTTTIQTSHQKHPEQIPQNSGRNQEMGSTSDRAEMQRGNTSAKAVDKRKTLSIKNPSNVDQYGNPHTG